MKRKYKKFIEKNIFWIILGLIILFVILSNQNILPFSLGDVSNIPNAVSSGGGGSGGFGG
jgi:hypothetical protein